jgi:hypothetical protein
MTPHLRNDDGQIQNPHRQALTAARTGRHFRRQRERHVERYLYGTVVMVRSVKVRASKSKLLAQTSLDKENTFAVKKATCIEGWPDSKVNCYL